MNNSQASRVCASNKDNTVVVVPIGWYAYVCKNRFIDVSLFGGTNHVQIIHAFGNGWDIGIGLCNMFIP